MRKCFEAPTWKQTAKNRRSLTRPETILPSPCTRFLFTTETAGELKNSTAIAHLGVGEGESEVILVVLHACFVHQLDASVGHLGHRVAAPATCRRITNACVKAALFRILEFIIYTSATFEADSQLTHSLAHRLFVCSLQQKLVRLR